MKSLIHIAEPVGEFKEAGSIRSGWKSQESIFENRTPLPQDKKERVIYYLENCGYTADIAFGGIDDMFNPEVKMSDDTRLMSGWNSYIDGYWMWFAYYSYFIEKYDVFVNPLFVEHVMNHESKRKFTFDEIKKIALDSGLADAPFSKSTDVWKDPRI